MHVCDTVLPHEKPEFLISRGLFWSGFAEMVRGLRGLSQKMKSWNGAISTVSCAGAQKGARYCGYRTGAATASFRGNARRAGKVPPRFGLSQNAEPGRVEGQSGRAGRSYPLAAAMAGERIWPTAAKPSGRTESWLPGLAERPECGPGEGGKSGFPWDRTGWPGSRYGPDRTQMGLASGGEQSQPNCVARASAAWRASAVDSGELPRGAAAQATGRA